MLWSSPLTPGALEQSIRYYALIAGGTAALGWVYVGVLLVAFIAAAGKLCSDWGKGGEVLFDGASVCEYGLAARAEGRVRGKPGHTEIAGFRGIAVCPEASGPNFRSS